MTVLTTSPCELRVNPETTTWGCGERREDDVHKLVVVHPKTGRGLLIEPNGSGDDFVIRPLSPEVTHKALNT